MTEDGGLRKRKEKIGKRTEDGGWKTGKKQ